MSAASPTQWARAYVELGLQAQNLAQTCPLHGQNEECNICAFAFHAGELFGSFGRRMLEAAESDRPTVAVQAQVVGRGECGA